MTTGERVTLVDDDKDVGTPFPRPSSATEMTRDDTAEDDARANDADEATTTPSNINDAAKKTTKLCVFHQRGRCASGDACAYSHANATPPSARRGRGHRTPRMTHASNCGCRACRPDGVETGEAKADGSSSSEEEGAVPSDIVRREAEEKRIRDEEILSACSRITQPSRVMFWRAFLHSASEGNGNKLLPYWKRDDDDNGANDDANDDRKASKRPRVDDVRDDAS
jgi:hypothetical protein